MLDTEYKFGEVMELASLIDYGTDRVEFNRVFENEHGGVTLLAFRAGQKLDEHIAPAELMVSVIEGEIEFTMIDTIHVIRPGNFMLIGANIPHKVLARKDSKVALFKVKP